MNWRPIRGWTKPLHERGMKADSMPERLLIGPGSPPSIDPVYPELSAPPEPCPNSDAEFGLKRNSIPHSALKGIRSHPSGPAARVGFPSLQQAQLVQPACLEPVAPHVLCMGNPR